MPVPASGVFSFPLLQQPPGVFFGGKKEQKVRKGQFVEQFLWARQCKNTHLILTLRDMYDEACLSRATDFQFFLQGTGLKVLTT